MKRAGKFLLRLTPKESEEFDHIIEKLEDECDISHQRQSEFIFAGFKQYAENLLASYIPSDTQTKTQKSNLQQKRDFIDNMIEVVRKDSYIYLSDAINRLFFSNLVFDNDIRTNSKWFHNFLSSPELMLLYIPYYYKKKDSDIHDFIIIHRRSRWYPQLNRHLFDVKKDFYLVTNANTKFNTYRERLMKILKYKAKRLEMDRVEKVMFNALLFEIKQLEEKPIYDNCDLVLKEVVQLRSTLNFPEADELLEKEKEHNRNMNDNGMKYLEALGK